MKIVHAVQELFALGVDNCVVIEEDDYPMVTKIFNKAKQNKAFLNDGEGEEQCAVKFPGKAQELLTYGQIQEKCRLMIAA